jgi:DNA adenine methylase
MKIGALAPWSGSNRLLAAAVGQALAGCSWCGVPFCGGLSELVHIDCRTGVANDLHRGIVNMALATAHPILGPQLYRRLRRLAFHPDTLADAQTRCRARQAVGRPHREEMPDIEYAVDYFVVAWMARNGTAGTRGELDAGLSTRWDAGGGDSVVRFQGAIAGLVEWRRILARWTFDCRDAFEFIGKIKDAADTGCYVDPPFPGVGRGYLHNAGQTAADELTWHTRLRDALDRFRLTRVVCRFYDHEVIRQLYPEPGWRWQRLTGGKNQANKEAPEVLLIRNAPREQGGLF